MNSLWNSAVSRLSEKIAPQNYEMWLSPIECHSIEGNRILLRAPNQYVRLWFESNYLPIILEDLQREEPRDFRVEFEVLEGGSGLSPMPPEDDSIPTPATAQDDAIPSRTSHDASQPISNAGLNWKYTFDTFVIGPSNQLAHASARAVSSIFPPKYNPVFLCGGAGLGKTHLMHAIGHEILRQRPNTRVLYLSGERFVNDFIQSLRNQRMEEFRTRYRENCDVLLLDDIQFIANKDSTQEEFFHTFNTLHEKQKQIVLSADRKPIEIPDIAERLRTRFSMGLTADIEPPELEVRVAILRKKAAAEGIPLPDEVSLYIAESIRSNVRELEGALIRLAAYASLSRREITVDFARETLAGVISRPNEHLSIDHVVKIVANYYGIKLVDLKGGRRHKSVAGPRAIAMYLARKHTGESYPDLGRAFGNKHHTTVLSACEKISERVKTDLALRHELHTIENLLTR